MDDMVLYSFLVKELTSQHMEDINGLVLTITISELADKYSNQNLVSTSQR